MADGSSGRTLRREFAGGDPYHFGGVDKMIAPTLLDIGANAGVAAISWLEHGGKDVLCIEPDPESLAALRLNAAGRPAIRVVEAGLGPGGRLVLANEARRSLSRLWLQNSNALEGAGPLALPMADLVRMAGPDPAKVWVKMDCEGAEACLLNDPAGLAALGRCAGLAAEIHLAPDGTIAPKLAMALRRALAATHTDVVALDGRRSRRIGKLDHLRLANLALAQDWPAGSGLPASWGRLRCALCPDRMACLDSGNWRRNYPTMARRCSLVAVDNFMRRLPKGAKVLEVGHGKLRSCKPAAVAHGLHWHGTDPSPNACGRADERLGSAEHIPWPAAEFAGALACNSIEHWRAHNEGPRAGLREMLRVTAPGGLLHVVVPLADHGDPVFELPMVGRIHRLLRDCGLVDLEVGVRGPLNVRGWPSLLEVVGRRP